MSIIARFECAAHPDLSSTAKLVAELLDQKTARRQSVSHVGTPEIAGWVGRSVRTVQVALGELQQSGALLVKRAWSVSSGHVIALLWRTRQAPAAPNFFGHSDCAGQVTAAAPDSAPPGPPIEVPEGELEREIDGGAGAPPPPPVQKSLPGPDPEEVKPLAERAGKIAPSPGPVGKLRAF